MSDQNPTRSRSMVSSTPRPLAILLALFLLVPAAFLFAPCGAKSAQATPSTTPLEKAWVTDGTVRSILPAGDVTYIGGSFSHIGPVTAYGVPLEASSGSPLSEFPEVNGPVRTAVPDGAGGWYIGGQFTRVGGAVRNNIAHILSTGEVSAWNPDVNNQVYAIALSGSAVYAGGDFIAVNLGTTPLNRHRIAAFNNTDGAALDWAPYIVGGDFYETSTIYALAVSGGTVYAGGDFDHVQEETLIDRNNIAAFNSADGTTTVWDPDINGVVRSLAVSSSTVFAGGDFSTVNQGTTPLTRSRIAAFNNSTGTATSWNPDVNGDVLALALTETSVYAGGGFHTVNQGTTPLTRNHIAAFNNSDGTATAWDPDVDGTVSALALSETSVYAGGLFSTVNQGTKPRARNCIAAFYISDGAATEWDPYAGGPVYALVASNKTVYAGGAFTVIGGLIRHNIAAIDTDPASPTYGQPTDWDPDADAAVSALALSGTTLYVGGGFTAIGGQARTGIAALGTTKMTDMATDWDPDADGGVNVLALSGTTLFVGGDFTAIGGQERAGIAALDTTKMTDMATDWDPGDSGISLRSMAVSGTTVFVGGWGDYETLCAGPWAIDADPASPTYGYSLATWHPGPIQSNPEDRPFPIYALAVSGSTIYVGGEFSMMGLEDRNNIAAVDIDPASPTYGQSTGWDPDADDAVLALALSGTTLYAGGEFTSIGGGGGGRLAALDTSTGLSTSWYTFADDTVSAIAVSGGTVYAGGAFSNVAQKVRPSLAVFVSAPTISSITPAAGNNTGVVDITDLAGTDFRYGATVILRRDGQTDIPASSVNVVSGTRITCSFDLTGAEVGAWDVVVNNDDTQTGTLVGGFNVLPPAPAITTVSPTSARIGTLVTITGTDFGATRGTSTVKFGTVNTTYYESWSDTQIVCKVPAGTAGALDLSVATAGGTSNLMPFKVLPRITKLAPKSGVVGTVVTITGTGFGASRGTSYVSFGAVKATKYISWSPTQIQVKVPAGVYGLRNLSVTTAGGKSNLMPFKVTPRITKLSPLSGTPGTVVTITGTAFGDKRGTSTVTFGITQVTRYVSWSNTQIVCKVPATGTGTKLVKVTTGGGTSAGVSFTVK
jgi:IPT/TIG domain